MRDLILLLMVAQVSCMTTGKSLNIPSSPEDKDIRVFLPCWDAKANVETVIWSGSTEMGTAEVSEALSGNTKRELVLDVMSETNEIWKNSTYICSLQAALSLLLMFWFCFQMDTSLHKRQGTKRPLFHPTATSSTMRHVTTKSRKMWIWRQILETLETKLLSPFWEETITKMWLPSAGTKSTFQHHCMQTVELRPNKCSKRLLQ